MISRVLLPVAALFGSFACADRQASQGSSLASDASVEMATIDLKEISHWSQYRPYNFKRSASPAGRLVLRMRTELSDLSPTLTKCMARLQIVIDGRNVRKTVDLGTFEPRSKRDDSIVMDGIHADVSYSSPSLQLNCESGWAPEDPQGESEPQKPNEPQPDNPDSQNPLNIAASIESIDENWRTEAHKSLNVNVNVSPNQAETCLWNASSPEGSSITLKSWPGTETQLAFTMILPVNSSMSSLTVKYRCVIDKKYHIGNITLTPSRH